MKPSMAPLLVTLLCLLAACAGPATPAPTTPVQDPDQPEASITATPGGRTAAFTLILNDVQARPGEEASFTPAAMGDLLSIGGQAQSGDDSRARLDLVPDGTILRLGPNTLFQLQALEQAGGDPQTRLRLLFGQLFILLSGGELDVETDYGLSSVRGSMMGVSFNSENGMAVTCLEGHCSLGNDAGSVDLVAGQGSSIPAPGAAPTPPRDLDDVDIGVWKQNAPEAFAVLEPEGHPPATGPLNTHPLTFVLTNNCTDPHTQPVSDWLWTFERLPDANGSGFTETFVIPPGQSINGTLPPGQYVVTNWFDGRQDGPEMLDSTVTNLESILCSDTP
ncbi:MAG: FecR domain-containing protein [Anaerolineales bacterium]|nr:FecR domain-containing protein [Anaerolineales bacterium]